MAEKRARPKSKEANARKGTITSVSEEIGISDSPDKAETTAEIIRRTGKTETAVIKELHLFNNQGILRMTRVKRPGLGGMHSVQAWWIERTKTSEVM
jgi:hypothetical protein